MTPPGHQPHPRAARRVVAFEAPDCPAWADDPTLAVSLRSIREWVEHDRATRRAEGRLAGEPAPAGAAKAKGRKKDPAPNQSSMFATSTGDDSDGKYDE